MKEQVKFFGLGVCGFFWWGWVFVCGVFLKPYDNDNIYSSLIKTQMGKN